MISGVRKRWVAGVADDPRAARSSRADRSEAPAAIAPAAQPLAPVVQPPGTIPAHMLPHDLSPWQMFMAADIVVKAVMIGLAFASLVTWTVWLAKSIEIPVRERRARREPLARTCAIARRSAA